MIPQLGQNVKLKNCAAEWNSTAEAEKTPQGLISSPAGASQLQTGISILG
jgi:hypothetical protein